jgi:hypothetical protein
MLGASERPFRMSQGFGGGRCLPILRSDYRIP